MPELLKLVRRRKYVFGAWDKVYEAGRQSPSLSTRTAVAKFSESAPRQLEKIQRELRDGSYRFRPGHGVPIRRKGKDPRPIIVQDVRDRVVQRSLLDVVWSVSEVRTRIDHGRSFGGVPGRGVRDALTPVALAVVNGSARYFIRSDIKSFFAALPRKHAIEALTTLLPDNSLGEFLTEATHVELANHEALGQLIDFFPDEVTGVPQGHALSALLGNIILSDFDVAINEGGASGVRYLDDFLILAPDKKTAWAAFRRAKAGLKKLGLESYAPGKSSKAKEGTARRRFEFLGCEVSPGFVRPSSSNRRKLMESVQARLNASRRVMLTNGFGTPASNDHSVTSTLTAVSRLIRGWSEQYAFCNYDQLQRDMDQDIDELLSEYLGTYSGRRKRMTSLDKRRAVGVWLVQDATRDPILGAEAEGGGSGYQQSRRARA